MRIGGKEIKDECQYCGSVLNCELFKQGHGIKQQRSNLARMLDCQIKHKEKRNERE